MRASAGSLKAHHWFVRTKSPVHPLAFVPTPQQVHTTFFFKKKEEESCFDTGFYELYKLLVPPNIIYYVRLKYLNAN